MLGKRAPDRGGRRRPQGRLPRGPAQQEEQEDIVTSSLLEMAAGDASSKQKLSSSITAGLLWLRSLFC